MVTQTITICVVFLVYCADLYVDCLNFCFVLLHVAYLLLSGIVCFPIYARHL